MIASRPSGAVPGLHKRRSEALIVVAPYAGAILCVGVAALLRLALDPFLADRYTLSFFLLAVVAAAFIGGTRPALFATVFAWLIAIFFFIAPRGSFVPLPVAEVVGSIVFWLVGVAVALIAGRLSFLRRLAERREAEKAGQLAHLAERLRFSDRLSLIGMLTAGVGHDIGNMLMPMRVRLDVLSDRLNRSGVSTEEIASLRASAEYLASLARGLSHLVADPQSACGGRTDLQPWCAGITPLLRSALPRSIALECRIADNLPSVALAPHSLSQAVFNAVQNAAKAIGQRGGRIEVFGERDEETGGVRLTVRDDGPGMSEDTLHRINQGETGPRANGGGLGVPLIRSIVEAAGGRLNITSRLGLGTTVRLDFPAVRDAVNLPDLTASPASSHRPSQIRGFSA